MGWTTTEAGWTTTEAELLPILDSLSPKRMEVTSVGRGAGENRADTPVFNDWDGTNRPRSRGVGH